MGTVVSFRTRGELIQQDAQHAAALTQAERMQLYVEHTNHVCCKLIEYYKLTGTWSPECETPMAQAVGHLHRVCELIAKEE